MSVTTEATLSGYRVLVVEDQFFLADDLVYALDGLGADVVRPVPTLAEALAMLRAGTPIDAAVLDVNLLDGLCFPLT